jgi:large subunit ribosomal protein L7/L12
MAKLSTDELLDAFKEMTLIELSEFVKQFEETFEGHRRRPVAVAGRPGRWRWRRRCPGRGGEGRVRRCPRSCRRQEDPGHQGGSWTHEPRPEGGQGPRRRRPQAVLEKVNKEAADKAKELSKLPALRSRLSDSQLVSLKLGRVTIVTRPNFLLPSCEIDACAIRGNQKSCRILTPKSRPGIDLRVSMRLDCTFAPVLTCHHLLNVST